MKQRDNGTSGRERFSDRAGRYAPLRTAPPPGFLPAYSMPNSEPPEDAAAGAVGAAGAGCTSGAVATGAG